MQKKKKYSGLVANLPLSWSDCILKYLVGVNLIYLPLSAYEAKFAISLFERAFKMMKNGIYFIVIALLVAELFKILIYAN